MELQDVLCDGESEAGAVFGASGFLLLIELVPDPLQLGFFDGLAFVDDADPHVAAFGMGFDGHLSCCRCVLDGV